VAEGEVLMSAATASARRPADRKVQLVTTLFLLLFLVYTLTPLFYLLVSITKNNSELFDSFGLWFARDLHVGENLKSVFTYDGGVYLRWLRNTAFYSITSALGASLIASAAGYAFAKLEFVGRRWLFVFILGAIMVPYTALVIPLFLLLTKMGLVNTPFAVILPSMVSPLGVYLMRVYSERAIPDELLDAARIDGAGEARVFVSVVARLLVPGFVTVLLLSFVGAWNNYFLPLVVLSNSNLFPLTVGLASWYQQASAGSGAEALFSLVLTGALVSILPIILVFLLLQRFWQSGLSMGSLK
jgi:multiple sugar transport system permease protein